MDVQSSALTLLFVLPFVSWACDISGDLKYVNDSCTNDQECYSGSTKVSVSCKRGRCECNDGYAASVQWFTANQKRTVCAYAPSEGQSCATVCQKPYTCSETGDTALKTCQCLPPMVKKDGVCSMTCKSDELFVFGACKKRCSQEEIKLPNGDCKKMGELDEPCELDLQCSAPFSLCSNGVCKCMNGFNPDTKKQACVSGDAKCPIGDPIRDRDGRPVACKIVKSPEPFRSDRKHILQVAPSTLLVDTCAGDGQFCMIISGQGYPTIGAVGHCCRKPDLSCPIGRPHPNATCEASLIGADGRVAPYCPYESHSCIYYSFGGGSYQRSICCPKMCDNEQVSSGGACYPRRNYGDPCNVDEQCQGSNGRCSGGKCSCPQGFEAVGSAPYIYCQKTCPGDQILVGGDRCEPPSKLGDPCDPMAPGRCPRGSYCSPEKLVCDCMCEYVKLNDRLCIPQPTCSRHIVPPIGAPIDVRVPLTKDFHLCRIPGSADGDGPNPNSTTADPAILDKCPDNSYCSIYVASFGLCCPVPEKPFCLRGAQPGAKCDPSKPKSCGPDSFCYRYIDPIGVEDNGFGYVCCPSLLSQTLPPFQ